MAEVIALALGSPDKRAAVDPERTRQGTAEVTTAAAIMASVAAVSAAKLGRRSAE
jgi:hypothetical protein